MCYAELLGKKKKRKSQQQTLIEQSSPLPCVRNNAGSLAEPNLIYSILLLHLHSNLKIHLSRADMPNCKQVEKEQVRVTKMHFVLVTASIHNMSMTLASTLNLWLKSSLATTYLAVRGSALD